MSFVAWIAFGLVAGLIANKLVLGRGAGALLDVLLGVVGAIVGGLLFDVIGAVGFTGFNLWSLFVAVLGSTIVLFVYHTIPRRGVA